MGRFEVWAWLWGLLFTIHLVGFPIALPLFVLLYLRSYGGSWLTVTILTAVTGSFLYGVYDYFLRGPLAETLARFSLLTFGSLNRLDLLQTKTRCRRLEIRAIEQWSPFPAFSIFNLELSNALNILLRKKLVEGVT